MPRLKIIPSVQGDQGRAQDCSICKNSKNCWEEGIKDEHVILNLLTCRIKRGIDVNRSVRLFLRMVRPKLKTYAKIAIKGTSIDLDIALADLESATIEYIQNHYMMGEIAFPLHYLFGHPNGVIYHYANNYGKKTRRYEDTHELHSEGQDEDGGEDYAPPPDEEENETEETRRAREIIDDGVTLTGEEYQVLQFCLANAAEGKRPLNGLHIYISKVTGIPRTKVAKIYKDATEKVVQAVKDIQ